MIQVVKHKRKRTAKSIPRSKEKPMGLEREYELADAVQAGLDAEGMPATPESIAAMQELVSKNMGLALYAARKLPPSYEYLRDDAFHHGIIGLMIAARQFKRAKAEIAGTSFSSFAFHTVYREVRRFAFCRSTVITIPAHAAESLRELGKLSAEERESHRHYTKYYMPARRARTAATGESVDRDEILQSRIATAQDDEDAAGRDQDHHQVMAARYLQLTSPRRAEALRMRYGFGGKDPVGDAVIGKAMGIGRAGASILCCSGIRQIRKKLLARGNT